MKKLTFTLFLIPLMLLSQTPEGSIKDLNEGILFVRLMTRENTINALRNAGQDEQAISIIESQQELNLEITKAFSDHFDFCPVLFFYSSCSEPIKDREFTSCLMDANLNQLPEANMPDIDEFFIAEFSHVESSDEKYFTHYSLEETQDDGKEIRKNYGGDTEIGAAALIIRDSEFAQLQDPFPFHVRTREGTPWKRSKAKTVGLMNKELHNFLSNSQKGGD